ncbi:uncharacterized protein CLUP02_09694 [Colletotrichum lupini]|uniref:Uncharacterized protein n=1 Tax=Colletotrichum lupini TaxID=145971 RepID=A0A9Q8SVY8_9PEZI|nr:uncharacterized protein CLUP02_09694 [Colletotrichum lupini]UQC84198.1 hypothetical protein CLUP02_09694 [Colletotrichum lupini]
MAKSWNAVMYYRHLQCTRYRDIGSSLSRVIAALRRAESLQKQLGKSPFCAAMSNSPVGDDLQFPPNQQSLDRNYNHKSYCTSCEVAYSEPRLGCDEALILDQKRPHKTNDRNRHAQIAYRHFFGSVQIKTAAERQRSYRDINTTYMGPSCGVESLGLTNLDFSPRAEIRGFCPVIEEGAVGNGVIFLMWERLVSNQPGSLVYYIYFKLSIDWQCSLCKHLSSPQNDFGTYLPYLEEQVHRLLTDILTELVCASADLKSNSDQIPLRVQGAWDTRGWQVGLHFSTGGTWVRIGDSTPSLFSKLGVTATVFTPKRFRLTTTAATGSKPVPIISQPSVRSGNYPRQEDLDQSPSMFPFKCRVVKIRERAGTCVPVARSNSSLTLPDILMIGDHRGRLDFNSSPIPGLDLLISPSSSGRHRKVINEITVALQFFRHNTQFTTFLLRLHAYEPSMVEQIATGKKPGSHFVHVHIKDQKSARFNNAPHRLYTSAMDRYPCINRYKYTVNCPSWVWVYRTRCENCVLAVAKFTKESYALIRHQTMISNNEACIYVRTNLVYLVAESWAYKYAMSAFKELRSYAPCRGADEILDAAWRIDQYLQSRLDVFCQPQDELPPGQTLRQSPVEKARSEVENLDIGGLTRGKQAHRMDFCMSMRLNKFDYSLINAPKPCNSSLPAIGTITKGVSESSSSGNEDMRNLQDAGLNSTSYPIDCCKATVHPKLSAADISLLKLSNSRQSGLGTCASCPSDWPLVKMRLCSGKIPKSLSEKGLAFDLNRYLHTVSSCRTPNTILARMHNQATFYHTYLSLVHTLCPSHITSSGTKATPSFLMDIHLVVGISHASFRDTQITLKSDILAKEN